MKSTSFKDILDELQRIDGTAEVATYEHFLLKNSGKMTLKRCELEFQELYIRNYI